MDKIKYPHLTKKIASELLKKETGSAVELVRSENQTPGGRYEALRGRHYITIETNWPDADANYFVVKISDYQGGTIHHYYHADTLKEDWEMDDISRYKNMLEDVLDIIESFQQADPDDAFIEVLLAKIGKIKYERNKLQRRVTE